uniref:Chemokine interleukin-8-like domain-containing protein n=1 Tax=Sinocyclocheilus anshuiensis TaxID=1608454 RepID=A0A671NQZ2_9TELE
PVCKWARLDFLLYLKLTLKFSQGPDKCCFSFSNIKIPIKQVESHHTTHLECHRSGIIVITKAQREICVDPTERWVQRLINLVDMSQSSD